MESSSVLVLLIGIGLGLYFLSQNEAEKVDIRITDTVADEYDYVIVGGGSAGCVLASRLSEDDGVSVLLLEAGGLSDDPKLHEPSKWLDMLDSKLKFTWRFYTTQQTESSQGMKNRQGAWFRGRVLGGSSISNAMQYTRGSPYDFDGWEAMGAKGWGYKDVLPYFLKSEDVAVSELKNSKFHTTGGPLTVSSGKVSSLADKLIQAGRELGYSYTDYNSNDPEGFSNLQLTVKNGRRRDAASAFLGGTADRDNLDISTDSYVTKIKLVNKRADGVYFVKNGLKQYVRARKEVIISAGSMKSPQLLMLSGIGPASHLSEHGISVVADLPVGQNLNDHEMVLLSARINQSLDITPEWRESFLAKLEYKLFGSGVNAITGNEVNVFIQTDETKRGKAFPDIQIVFVSSLAHAFLKIMNIETQVAIEYMPFSKQDHGISAGIVLAHPESTGSIKLVSTDPFDFPDINPQYFTKKKDMDVMIKGMRFWERFLQTKTIQELGVNIDDTKMAFCSQHEFRSDAYWECVVRHLGTTVWHHSGTCKMGDENDKTAVVDPQLRVRGIKALRVVDTSVFPFVTSGNTNAPVIMVAEKAADMIRGKDTVKQFRKL